MPTNLYGAYDNFDLKNSHVMPALIRKFLEARDNKQEKLRYGVLAVLLGSSCMLKI